MEITNRVRIKIGTMPYTITTQESEEYVHQLTDEINHALAALMKKNRALSFTDALVLCLFSMADANHKSEQNADHMREQLTNYLRDIEDAAKIRIEIEELKNEVTRLRRELSLSREIPQNSEKSGKGGSAGE